MNRLRVLVVEDRSADAELMVAELRRAGFAFDWHRVDTERDFLTHLNPLPDIVLADFHMPQFTGLRALQILKERGLDIPFIIVSGSIGEEVAVDAMQHGASDYLLKDRLIRLGAAVNRALEAKHLRDEERKAKEELAMARNLLDTLTAVYATAQKLSQSLDLDQLARYVVETAVRTFGARFAWIGHAEPGGAIRRLAHWPNRDGYLRDFAPRWDESSAGQGPSGRAIRSGFPVVVDDVASDASLIHRDILVSLGLKSAGAFPLISRDKPFGVLVLHGAEDNFFGPTRTEFFQAFANQAAAALENARLLNEAEGRLQQLQALRSIDMAITASLDLRVVLNVILDQVTTHLKVDAAGVLLFDPYTQTLQFATNRGFRSRALQGT